MKSWAPALMRLSLRTDQVPVATGSLEVWPESHWPAFALRQADGLQSYQAW